MDSNAQQPQQPVSQQPVTPQPVQQPAIPTVSAKSPLPKILLIVLGTVIFLGLIGGAYYLGTQKSATMVFNEKTVAVPTKTMTVVPTSAVTPTADPTANWKTYTSSAEKASFKYPQDWIVTKPAIQSNYPDADQTAVQSPSGAIKISWVSALSGFGGGCNSNVPLGQTDACSLFTLVDKTPITGAPGFFVVSGTLTRDGINYQPFLAVQDSGNGELLSTQRTMGYDMFTGKNNGSLPENRGQNTTALFSTSDAYGRGPSLTQADANAWFNKPEVQQAKQILLTLTY